MARARNGRDWIAWLSPGVMILIGVVLFLIPAPPTSLIGTVLIIVGGVLWLAEYFTRDRGRDRGREREREREREHDRERRGSEMD